MTLGESHGCPNLSFLCAMVTARWYLALGEHGSSVLMVQAGMFLAQPLPIKVGGGDIYKEQLKQLPQH